MAVSAKFIADFTQFNTAVQKAEVTLRTFTSGIKTVDRDLAKFGNQFNGTKIIQDATLMARAIESIGGASKLTAQEQARVNATVTEAIAKYNALGQEAPADIQRLATETQKLEAKTTMADKAVGLLKSSFGQFTAANLASQGIQSVITKVNEFIVTGTKLPGVQASFERLTSSVKQDSGEMLSAMTTATRGMVSNYDLMLSANKSVLLGLPVTAESMGELANAATTLGRAMGKDATSSLDDLITALGRSSPMILDNLGLTVKVGEANEAYAQKLGKTAEQLTDAEKKMAFYQAAMEAARAKTAELGEQTKTLGEIIETVWTKVGNLISSTTGVINVGLGQALSSVKEFLKFSLEVVNLGPGLALQFAQMRAFAEQASRSQGGGQFQAGTPGAAERDASAGSSFADQLRRVREELGRLTPAQREQIEAAIAMGASTQDMAKALGVSESALRIYSTSAKEATKATSDAADEARRAASEFSNWLGERRMQDDRTFMDRMSFDQAKDSLAGIAAFSKEWQDQQTAARDQHAMVFLQRELEDYNHRQAAAKEHWKTMSQIANDYGLRQMEKDALRMKGVFGGLFDGLKTSGKGLLEGLTGGAGIGGLFSNLGKGIMDGFGKMLSGGITSLIGGGINLAIKGISGLVGKLFGGEGKKTNDTRDDAIAKMFGTTDNLRKMAGEAGVSLDAFFKADRVKEFEVALAQVTAGLEKHKLKTEELDALRQSSADAALQKQQMLQEAVDRYGLKLNELGPILKKQEMAKQAEQLLNDWKLLTEAGVETENVINAMGGSFNEFIQNAVEFGIEIPNRMRPMLEQMLEQGLLTDEAGDKLKDLSKLTFGDSLEDQFSRVLEKIEAMIDAINRIPSSIDIDVNANPRNPRFDIDDGGRELPGYRTGTRGQFLNFGSGTDVRLHGKERVMTEAEGRAESGLWAALMEEVSGLRRDLRHSSQDNAIQIAAAMNTVRLRAT